MVFYSINVQFEEKLGKFYQKLTDGTIVNPMAQK